MVLDGLGKPLSYQDVPEPSIDEDEVLLETKACGVCATDLKIISGERISPPMPHILGHEPSGVVAKTGKKVKKFREGDRVAVAARVTCGTCKNCSEGRENICLGVVRHLGFDAPGGFAQFMKAPERNLVPIPDGVSFEQGAICVGAISAPLHAVKRAGMVLGQTVALVGAGGVGLHALQILKGAGAKVAAIDIADHKLELAKSLGADHTFNPTKERVDEEVKKLTAGMGADVVFEVSGSPSAVLSALDIVRPGGKVILVGYSYHDLVLRTADIEQKETMIVSSRSYSHVDLVDAMDLVRDRVVQPIIHRRYPLKEANAALDFVRQSEAPGRAVLDMGL